MSRYRTLEEDRRESWLERGQTTQAIIGVHCFIFNLKIYIETISTMF